MPGEHASHQTRQEYGQTGTRSWLEVESPVRVVEHGAVFLHPIERAVIPWPNR